MNDTPKQPHHEQRTEAARRADDLRKIGRSQADPASPRQERREPGSREQTVMQERGLTKPKEIALDSLIGSLQPDATKDKELASLSRSAETTAGSRDEIKPKRELHRFVLEEKQNDQHELPSKGFSNVASTEIKAASLDEKKGRTAPDPTTQAGTSKKMDEAEVTKKRAEQEIQEAKKRTGQEKTTNPVSRSSPTTRPAKTPKPRGRDR